MEDFVMASTSGPAVRSRGPVRISLPASVAYNADALKKTIASVVDRIGCRACFSGADCHFSVERDLSVDKHGAVNHLPQPSPWLAAGPNPSPWNVSVAFQGKVAYNIDQVYQAVDNVVGLLGCLGCHSGFDVGYINEVILIGVDQNLQAQQYGAQISA
jgi:hypothetical protein